MVPSASCEDAAGKEVLGWLNLLPGSSPFPRLQLPSYLSLPSGRDRDTSFCAWHGLGFFSYGPGQDRPLPLGMAVRVEQAHRTKEAAQAGVQWVWGKTPPEPGSALTWLAGDLFTLQVLCYIDGAECKIRPENKPDEYCS